MTVHKMSVTPKAAVHKKKAKTPTSATPKDEGILVIKDYGEGVIPRSHISSVVKAAVKLGASKIPSDKKKKVGGLFEGDGKKIIAQITAIKVPKESRSHMVKCTLPHKLNASGSLGTALFVKDLTKNFKDDHEPTIHHFDDLLRSGNAREQIDEIIPLRGLKSEYQTFELKRRLSNKYDKFLADKRIMHRLSQPLGKHFFGKNKIPIPVDLEVKDLKAEFDRALHTSILPLTHKGASSVLTLGSTAMKMDDVVDNVLQFVDVLKEKYPGGWKNIRSLHLKTESSSPVPLHVSTTSVKEVGYVDAQKPKSAVRKPQVDELSTLPGAQVKVLADGTVKVRRVTDANWDLDHEEPFVSGSEDEGEEEKEETPKEEEKKKKDVKKKRRREASVEEAPSKKFKNTAEDSDSEDEQMYQNELEFMRKMAREEEEMERRNKEAPADDEVQDESKVVVVESDGEDEEDMAVDDICIKGESTSNSNKNKLDKPSRKERSKNIKTRKKMTKEAKAAKKSPAGKKAGPPSSFKGKKSKKK